MHKPSSEISCSEKENRVSHYVFFIFSTAFIIRIINLAATDLNAESVLFEDAALYWAIATSGDTFWSAAKYAVLEQTERAPGYLIFLTAVVNIFGAHFLPVLLIQSIVDSFTCLIIMALGQTLFSKNYWIFGFLAAVWPNLVLHSGMILTDCLFLFFFSCFLLSFTHLIKKQTIKSAILAGALLGLATLTRPVTQFIILLAPAFLPIILILSKMSLRAAFFQTILVFLVASTLVSPLVIKNYLKYDSLTLTSQNGTHLQNWVASEVIMLRDNIGRKEAVSRLAVQTEKILTKMSAHDQKNPFIVSKQQVKTAIKEIAGTSPKIIATSWLQGALINLTAPALMIDKRIRQLPHVSFSSDTRGSLSVRTGQFISKSSAIYVLVLITSATGAIIVSLFQFAGFLVQARINAMLAILSTLIVIYFLLINGPVGSPKYRIPIEPILIIWFGCAMISFWKFVKELFYRRTKL